MINPDCIMVDDPQEFELRKRKAWKKLEHEWARLDKARVDAGKVPYSYNRALKDWELVDTDPLVLPQDYEAYCEGMELVSDDHKQHVNDHGFLEQWRELEFRDAFLSSHNRTFITNFKTIRGDSV